MAKPIIIVIISLFYSLSAVAEDIHATSTSSVPSVSPVTVAITPSSNATPAIAPNISITVNQQPAAPASKAPIIPAGATAPRPPLPKAAAIKSTSNRIQIPPMPSIDIVINERYKNSAKIRRLYYLLGIQGSPRVIHLIDNRSLDVASKKDNIIIFQQRTFLSVLYFLRHAVEYTPDAVQQGLIELARYPNGKLYDLTDITKGLMRIHISNTRPDCANVKIFYRNHWFYIADNDVKTKNTFALLQQLSNLQAGNRPTQTPILTIPVR